LKAHARAVRRKNPIPTDQKSTAAGKAVYAAQCLSCHGPAGHGDGPAAKDLNPKPRNLSDPAIQSQTDGSIFWKLTEGRKPMPTFDKLISEDDRWNVINYVRTLAAKEGK
jgi:mono/diheme cytochrome c family protein